MTSHRIKANAFAPNDHAPWTLEEQQQILDNRTGCDADLAVKLGRSEQAVQTKRHHIRRNGMTDPGGAPGAYSYGGPENHGATCPGCQLALPLTGVCATTVDEEYVPWVCPRCGKGGDDDPLGPIKARPKTIIRCACGHASWSS